MNFPIYLYRAFISQRRSIQSINGNDRRVFLIDISSLSYNQCNSQFRYRTPKANISRFLSYYYTQQSTRRTVNFLQMFGLTSKNEEI